MNILKLNSVDEIKEYSSLNGYFEVDGRFYTTCPNCGYPIALDWHVTRVDLLRDTDTLERLRFCSADCAWDWQIDTSCCEYNASYFPYFIKCVGSDGLLSYHAEKEDAKKQIAKLMQLDTSRGNHNKFNYVIIDIEDVKQPYQIRCRENGDVIERFADLDVARGFLDACKKVDKANGDFEPDFYEIYNQNTEEIIE